MKKREIILDFTSLLDVTLIIIFFFVIFSHFDSEDKKAQTENKIAELQTAIEEAEDREATADKLISQLEKDLEIVRNSSERRAENVEEMLAYAQSGNIKALLIMQENNWIIRIISQESVISEIDFQDDIGTELSKAIEKAGYKKEDTIFCDFVFDGSLPGTASAYRSITKGFDMVKKEYQYLYYSETDLSIGEG